MLTIIVERKKCIGCGSCELICPILFKISKKDGKCILLKGKKKNKYYILKNINNNFYSTLKDTSENCPINIIKVSKTKK
ncbi:ferredoxin [Candidatus Shikimatogenerans bostrichidophilus]|uniref:ferredoxin n=1 Tax=Candidatus Shikimatogenerans bostrichidophilus TaxID=2943807 RepID=UPI002966B741